VPPNASGVHRLVYQRFFIYSTVATSNRVDLEELEKRKMGISKPGLSKDIVLQVLATCCFALQKCITILDNEGLILDHNTAAEASDMLLLHVKAYAWLAAFFYTERKMIFRIRPKLHYIWHQAMQLKKWRINIGAFATFHDESFLGKIKAVATACHGKTMTARVYERYILCLALLVHQHQQLDEATA